MSIDPLDIQPFSFLSAELKSALQPHLREFNWSAGDLLIRQDDLTDNCVHLLVKGSVEVVTRGEPRGAVIHIGHYFGDRTALFGGARSNTVLALEPSRSFKLDGAVLIQLLSDSPVFARAFADILREKQGLFADFDKFLAELQHGASRGHITIPRLLHLYRPLKSALHRKVNSTEIDFDALNYAIRRLPENVTRTLSWFLVSDLPYLYSDAENTFPAIHTDARRRAVWEMLPGKNLVLLRDGMSDLIDLISCLCLYAVEAKKIRERIGSPVVLKALMDCSNVRELVPRLPFSDEELDGLEALWPDDLHRRLKDMAAHHEGFHVGVYKPPDNYNSAHSEQWIQQVSDATVRLMGIGPGALDDDFPVHIVSSNTHSVTNCLSVWLRKQTPIILEWGNKARPDLFELDWADERDLVVALVRPYMAAHPDAAERRRLEDEGPGTAVLRATAFTGISVQLFDLASLPGEALPDGIRPRPGLLINIDYAFGQQAEPVIAGLIKLFSRQIRSINVLGKAGGMMGKRGDVLVATGFVEQLQDALMTPKTTVDIESLKARVPGRGVHVRRALTAAGTVLQNGTLLHYYRRVWGCVGLEMEGAWYCRRILESQQLGILRDDCDLRFLYYVSDLPLDEHTNLSAPMTVAEGIPPLYAATREVLKAIWTV